MPKGITFEKGISEGSRSHQEIYCNEIYSNEKKLPFYIEIDGLGKMRLRTFPAVLRMHESKKKEGHEKFYAEMMLFYPWRVETRDLERFVAEDCVTAYRNRRIVIDKNKKGLFPNEDTMNLLDPDEEIPDLELEKPHHIYDILDSQRQQENDADNEIGAEEDPQYAGRYPTEMTREEQQFEDVKYQKIALPEEADILDQTRRLVPEQLKVLEKVVDHCKSIVKSRKQIDAVTHGMLCIVHGGAGVGKSAVIRIISLWAEKILRRAGQNPNHPRVVLCAPTAKAASLIGK